MSTPLEPAIRTTPEPFGVKAILLLDELTNEPSSCVAVNLPVLGL